MIGAVSREHERGGASGSRFAFPPHARDFLAAAPEAYVAFGCGSPDAVLLIPFAEFQEWLEGMGTTEREDRFAITQLMQLTSATNKAP